MLPVAVQVALSGSYSSAETSVLAAVPPVVPPATRTLPSANSVTVLPPRASTIAPVGAQVGLAGAGEGLSGAAEALGEGSGERLASARGGSFTIPEPISAAPPRARASSSVTAIRTHGRRPETGWAAMALSSISCQRLGADTSSSDWKRVCRSLIARHQAGREGAADRGSGERGRQAG